MVVIRHSSRRLEHVRRRIAPAAIPVRVMVVKSAHVRLLLLVLLSTKATSARKGEAFDRLKSLLPSFLDLLLQVVCHVSLKAILALFIANLLVMALELILNLKLPQKFVLPDLY